MQNHIFNFEKGWLRLIITRLEFRLISKAFVLQILTHHMYIFNEYVLSKISCPRFCHFYHTCIVLLGLIHLSWENGIMTCGSQHRSLIKDDSLFGHGHLSCMGKRVWTRENQVVKCNFTFKKVNLFQMFKTFELRKPAGIETNKHCNFFREHFTNCHFSSIFR